MKRPAKANGSAGLASPAPPPNVDFRVAGALLAHPEQMSLRGAISMHSVRPMKKARKLEVGVFPPTEK